MTDLDPLVAYVHIPEKEFRKLAPQQPADVVVDALGGERFTGMISRISPTVDPKTGTFRARVEVPDPDAPPQARHVRTRQHRLRTTRGRAAAAARRDPGRGRHAVGVRRDGDKAEQRPVRTGLANNGWVEVVEGLDGSERVVVVGQAGLKTGTAVKVVDAAASPGAPAASTAKAK